MPTIQELHTKKPIVLNIANMVTPQHVADAISFIGASPIMFDDSSESKNLIKIADAFVINLGSTSEHDLQKARVAGKLANQKSFPSLSIRCL
jgi:hydroxyethylthiazole kinase